LPLTVISFVAAPAPEARRIVPAVGAVDSRCGTGRLAQISAIGHANQAVASTSGEPLKI
jgi:hypothetical protein